MVADFNGREEQFEGDENANLGDREYYSRRETQRHGLEELSLEELSRLFANTLLFLAD